MFLKLSCARWFLLDDYVQVAQYCFCQWLQTDDALPSLEDQGVRQLYPKGSNVGKVLDHPFPLELY